MLAIKVRWKKYLTPIFSKLIKGIIMKHMKTIFLVWLIFFSQNSFGANYQVTMNDRDSAGNRLAFDKEILSISSGDSVTWLPVDKGHNIEMVASPNNLKFSSSAGEEVTLKFEDPGIYYYRCSPHKSAGMIGLIIVDNNYSNIEQIKSSNAPGRAKIKLNSLLESLPK